MAGHPGAKGGHSQQAGGRLLYLGGSAALLGALSAGGGSPPVGSGNMRLRGAGAQEGRNLGFSPLANHPFSFGREQVLLE